MDNIEANNIVQVAVDEGEIHAPVEGEIHDVMDNIEANNIVQVAVDEGEIHAPVEGEIHDVMDNIEANNIIQVAVDEGEIHAPVDGEIHGDIESQDPQPPLEGEVTDYPLRAQVLRPAILGAIDGLLYTAALVLGVGAMQLPQNSTNMLLMTGVAGMLAGACSLALGEYVSVYTQYDIEVAQMKRISADDELEAMRKNLPSPLKAAFASGVGFMMGALLPLLVTGLVRDYDRIRLGVMIGTVSFALIVLGGGGAVIGNARPLKSSLRVLVGGWLAMGITFGVTKLVSSKLN